MRTNKINKNTDSKEIYRLASLLHNGGINIFFCTGGLKQIFKLIESFDCANETVTAVFLDIFSPFNHQIFFYRAKMDNEEKIVKAIEAAMVDAINAGYELHVHEPSTAKENIQFLNDLLNS